MSRAVRDRLTHLHPSFALQRLEPCSADLAVSVNVFAKVLFKPDDQGVELPEADPAYWVGQLPGETPKPVEKVMPEGSPLSGCYRLDAELSDRDETAAANVHLLAALGSFDSPFVPVFIRNDYNGYAWTDLPIIDKIEVSVGKTI